MFKDSWKVWRRKASQRIGAVEEVTERALVLPKAKPTEVIVIGVDSTGSEVQLKIGTGLKITGTTSPYTIEVDEG